MRLNDKKSCITATVTICNNKICTYSFIHISVDHFLFIH